MTEAKHLARRIFLRRHGFLRGNPKSLIRANDLLRCGECEYDLHRFRDLRILAIGRAAHAMLTGLVPVLPPDRAFSGAVSGPTLPRQHLPGLIPFKAVLQRLEYTISVRTNAKEGKAIVEDEVVEANGRSMSGRSSRSTLMETKY